MSLYQQLIQKYGAGRYRTLLVIQRRIHESNQEYGVRYAVNQFMGLQPEEYSLTVREKRERMQDQIHDLFRRIEIFNDGPIENRMFYDMVADMLTVDFYDDAPREHQLNFVERLGRITIRRVVRNTYDRSKFLYDVKQEFRDGIATPRGMIRVDQFRYEMAQLNIRSANQMIQIFIFYPADEVLTLRLVSDGPKKADTHMFYSAQQAKNDLIVDMDKYVNAQVELSSSLKDILEQLYRSAKTITDQKLRELLHKLSDQYNQFIRRFPRSADAIRQTILDPILKIIKQLFTEVMMSQKKFDMIVRQVRDQQLEEDQEYQNIRNEIVDNFKEIDEIMSRIQLQGEDILNQEQLEQQERDLIRSSQIEQEIELGGRQLEQMYQQLTSQYGSFQYNRDEDEGPMKQLRQQYADVTNFLNNLQERHKQKSMGEQMDIQDEDTGELLEVQAEQVRVKKQRQSMKSKVKNLKEKMIIKDKKVLGAMEETMQQLEQQDINNQQLIKIYRRLQQNVSAVDTKENREAKQQLLKLIRDKMQAIKLAQKQYLDLTNNIDSTLDAGLEGEILTKKVKRGDEQEQSRLAHQDLQQSIINQFRSLSDISQWEEYLNRSEVILSQVNLYDNIVVERQRRIDQLSQQVHRDNESGLRGVVQLSREQTLLQQQTELNQMYRFRSDESTKRIMELMRKLKEEKLSAEQRQQYQQQINREYADFVVEIHALQAENGSVSLNRFGIINQEEIGASQDVLDTAQLHFFNAYQESRQNMQDNINQFQQLIQNMGYNLQIQDAQRLMVTSSNSRQLFMDLTQLFPDLRLHQPMLDNVFDNFQRVQNQLRAASNQDMSQFLNQHKEKLEERKRNIEKDLLKLKEQMQEKDQEVENEIQQLRNELRKTVNNIKSTDKYGIDLRERIQKGLILRQQYLIRQINNQENEQRKILQQQADILQQNEQQQDELREQLKATQNTLEQIQQEQELDRVQIQQYVAQEGKYNAKINQLQENQQKMEEQIINQQQVLQQQQSNEKKSNLAVQQIAEDEKNKKKELQDKIKEQQQLIDELQTEIRDLNVFQEDYDQVRDQIQQQIEVYKSELDRLTLQEQDNQARIINLQSQSNMQLENINKLSQSQIDLQNQLKASQKQNQELIQHIDQTLETQNIESQRVQDLTQEMEQGQKTLKEQLQDSNTQNDKLQQQINKDNIQIGNLQKKINLLEQESDRDSQKIDSTYQELNDIRKQIRSKDNKIKGQENQIKLDIVSRQQLQMNIEELDNTIKELKSKDQSKEADLNQIRNDYQESVDYINQKVQEREQEIVNLRDQIQKDQNDRSAIIQQLQNMQQNNQQLQETNQIYTERIQQMQQEINRLLEQQDQQTIDQLQERNEQLQEQLFNLQLEADFDEDGQQKFQKQIDLLEQQIAISEQTIADMRVEGQRLQTNEQSLNETVDDLNQQIKDKQDEIKNQQQNIDILERRNQRIPGNERLLKRVIDKLRESEAQIAQLNEEREQLLKRQENKEIKMMDNVSKKVKKLREEIKLLESRQKQQKATITDRNNEIQQMRDQILVITQSRDEARQIIAERDQQIQILDLESQQQIERILSQTLMIKLQQEGMLVQIEQWNDLVDNEENWDILTRNVSREQINNFRRSGRITTLIDRADLINLLAVQRERISQRLLQDIDDIRREESQRVDLVINQSQRLLEDGIQQGIMVVRTELDFIQFLQQINQMVITGFIRFNISDNDLIIIDSTRLLRHNDSVILFENLIRRQIYENLRHNLTREQIEYVYNRYGINLGSEVQVDERLGEMRVQIEQNLGRRFTYQRGLGISLRLLRLKITKLRRNTRKEIKKKDTEIVQLGEIRAVGEYNFYEGSTYKQNIGLARLGAAIQVKLNTQLYETLPKQLNIMEDIAIKQYRDRQQLLEYIFGYEIKQAQLGALQNIEILTNRIQHMFTIEDNYNRFLLDNMQDTFMSEYDDYVDQINEQFSVIMDPWIDNYFYRDDQHGRVQYIDHQIAVLQNANDLMIRNDKYTFTQRDALVNDRDMGIYPFGEQVKVDIIQQLFPYRGEIYDNTIKDKVKEYQDIIFDIYKHTQRNINKNLQMLDGINQDMFIHNSHSIQNRLLLFQFLENMVDKIQHTETIQQHEQYMEQQYQSDYTIKKVKLFSNDPQLYNSQYTIDTQNMFFRLHKNIPSKYRSITPTSRQMLCIILTFHQFICSYPDISNNTKATLKQIFYPQINNKHYYEYNPTRNRILSYDFKERNQIILNTYPLQKQLQLCDNLLYKKGLKIQQVNDFITSKIVTKDRMNEFFISQNTINFYNMLVQEVQPFNYALQGQVFDNDIIQYYKVSIYKIIMGHLIYQMDKSMALQHTKKEASLQTVLELVRNNKYTDRTQRHFHLEINVATISENRLLKDDPIFYGENKLKVMNQSKLILHNKFNRFDPLHNHNAVHVVFKIKDFDYIDNADEKEVFDVLDRCVRRILAQIVDAQQLNINEETMVVDDNFFESFIVFFNPLFLYRHLYDLQQQLFINDNDYNAEVIQNGRLQYYHDNVRWEADNDFIPKGMFTFSEGLLFNNNFVNSPFRDKTREDITEGQDGVNRIQDLSISYIAFEKYMISSINLQIPAENNYNITKKMSNCLINYKTYSFSLSSNELQNDAPDTVYQEKRDAVNLPKVAKGIKFFMRDIWNQEIPHDMQNSNDEVSNILQQLYEYNCAVIIFQTLIIYQLVPRTNMDEVSRLINTENYIPSICKLNKINKYDEVFKILRESPNRLFEQLNMNIAKKIQNLKQVVMEIHLFDHDQYSENFTINVNIKDSWYIDRFYVVVWKSHAEIFNNEQKFKKLLKYLMKDNNYKQNYRNLQGIKRKRPLDHEERVKSYQQKEKDKNIIISYDLETSIEGSMQPYMVVFTLRMYNIKPETVFDIENFLGTVSKVVAYKEQNYYYIVTDDIVDPEQLQISFIRQIQSIREMTDKSINIHIIAHNGGKFDTIILLRYIFQTWGNNTQILGSLTDIRLIIIEQQKIYFEDSLQMTQLGSLNNACGAKGLNLGIQKLDLGEVQHLKQWQDYHNSPNKQILLDYCIHDVHMLDQLIKRFNYTIQEMLQSLYMSQFGKQLIQNMDNNIYILKQSIAATSYDLFMTYLVPDEQNDIYPIDNYIVYEMVKQSQRGGRTSAFNYAEQTNVHDMDIASSYPNQMVTYAYATRMGQKINILPDNFYQRFMQNNIDNIKQLSLYGVTYFDLTEYAHIGYFPIKCSKTNILFYPRQFGQRNYDLGIDEIFSYDEKITYLHAKNIFKNNVQWIWGFQIVNAMALFKHHGLVFDVKFEIKCLQAGKPFEAVQNMFDLRREAKQLGMSSKQAALKLFMNGFYGQMGMKDYPKTYYVNKNLISQDIDENDAAQKQILKNHLFKNYIKQFGEQNELFKGNNMSKIDINMVPNTDMVQFKVQQFNRLPSNEKSLYVHIVSQITAHARDQLNMAMYQLKLCIPDCKLLYCDTDSVYFKTDINRLDAQYFQDNSRKIQIQNDKQYPQFKQTFEIKIGSKLGFWNLYDNPKSSVYKSFQVFGKKFYWGMFDDDECQIKIKGSNKVDHDKNKKLMQEIKELGQSKKQQIQWKRTNLCIQQVNIIKLFKTGNYSEFPLANGETRPFLNQNEKLNFII